MWKIKEKVILLRNLVSKKISKNPSVPANVAGSGANSDQVGAVEAPESGNFLSAEAAEIARELSAFLQEYPLRTILNLTASVKKQRPFLEADGVVRAINRALDDKRGFALIRLGDGEGAFMRVSDEDESEFNAVYRANRANFAQTWYGGKPPSTDPELLSTLFEINKAATWADVVGLPYDVWIEHEYRILSHRGIFGLVNVFRGMHGLPEEGFAHQNINTTLASTGALASLLTGRAAVGLVSCHHDLPDALRRRFGIGEVEFHKLPAERGRIHIFGDKTNGDHFPTAFRQTLAALEKPHHGKLFLVAGGILGKFYCRKIKEFGGVAIDIGSIADAWIGALSRPGYSRDQML
jgi:hypothetical protein